MKQEKYEPLKDFLFANFETTTNIKDRLHTQDIVDIVCDNEMKYSGHIIAQVFKSMDLGEHKKRCSINKKIHSGYYYIRYKGET